MLNRHCCVRGVFCGPIGAIVVLVTFLAVPGRVHGSQQFRLIPVTNVSERGKSNPDVAAVCGRWESRFPKEFDSVAPLPAPDCKVSGASGLGPDRQVIYDIKTRQQKYDSPVSRTLEAGSRSWAGRQARQVTAPSRGCEGFGLQNFSDMTRDVNTLDFPWRVNCRIFTRFFDETGDYLILGHGSGVLIDPMHVLTSGYCLYLHEVERNGKTYVVNDWPFEVVVVPAYEEERRPFGDAAAVQLSVSERWIQEEDRNRDIGIIRLNRPIGVLTGWAGFSTEDDPDFYVDNVFGNASYPHADPYDGEYMYYWEGRFDRIDYDPAVGAWVGATVGIDRPPYLGQGGSGVFVAGEDYVIYAVESHECEGRAHFVRITQEAFDGILNFVVGSVPDDLDLLPFRTQTDTKAVEPGGDPLRCVISASQPFIC